MIRPHARRLLAVAAALVLGPHCAGAQPRVVPLQAPDTIVTMRAYAGGLFPIEGTFGRISGSLTYDPADPARCHVTISVDVASLTMGNADRRAEIVSPEFLDAAHHPSMEYEGECETQSAMAGVLDMRGVSRPLTLSMNHDGRRLTVTGSVVRAEWGMTAKPLLVGRTVRITVDTELPQ